MRQSERENMAHNTELMDCSICLQLLEDPVTTNCGHTFCMKCINGCWDVSNNRSFICPTCRQGSRTRPILKKNITLAALLEEHKKRRGSGDDDVEPGDVPCDVCAGKRKKASKFCLACLTSYCDSHLRPHFEVPSLKKHELIQATMSIKENICDRHNKLLEVYCHTDGQFLCLQCMMDEHKGHNTVTVGAEKSHMQRELQQSKQEIADKVLNTERKMKELTQAADSIRDAAWEACDSFERLCEEHIRSVERKCFEMREKIGKAEKVGVDWIENHLSEQRREHHKLRKRDDKVNQLLLTEDPVQFFKGFQALGDPPAFPDLHDNLGTLTEFVAAQKDKLKDIWNKEKDELSYHPERNFMSNVRKPRKSRKYLMTKYTDIQVDPNTVAACLRLSKRNREISWNDGSQTHPENPDRFMYYNQVLCKQGLQDNHYWEVEWDGGIVELAVSYKGIQRKGSGKDCSFGHNNFSWKMICSASGCQFWHNNLHKGQIPPFPFRRAGVHLNFTAGTLSFYSVSVDKTLTLMHEIQTTFTEPLYPGFSVDLGATLKIYAFQERLRRLRCLRQSSMI